MRTPSYLGDGVYVRWTEQGIVLTTEDGVQTTNRIVLDASVWFALVRFVSRGSPEPSWYVDDWRPLPEPKE